MFWENFSRLCLDKGKSPNAVAKELGISSGSITSWKQGRIPYHSTLLKLSDYFGISVGQLLGEPIKEKAPPFITYRADDDERERLNSVLLYLEQNGFVAPTGEQGNPQKGRDLADYEKVNDAERDLLSLFRQFPEDSQRLYLEALRASLKNRS